MNDPPYRIVRLITCGFCGGSMEREALDAVAVTILLARGAPGPAYGFYAHRACLTHALPSNLAAQVAKQFALEQPEAS
jgi:hypothetical protein